VKIGVLSICFLFALSMILPVETLAKGGGSGGRGGSSGSGRKGGSSSFGNRSQRRGLGEYVSNAPREKRIPRSSIKFAPPINYQSGVLKDSGGRIVRSESAREEFLKGRGLQSVPDGQEIDHKIPLYAGGRDEPSNMQLVTKGEHGAKTKVDYQLFGK
jgi:hypothetical protein